MPLEKTTSVPTASGGRMTFRQTSAGLEIQFIDSSNVPGDSATLSEDDLRSLLKDNFPTKCKAREAKTPANGAARNKQKSAGATVTV